MTGIAVGVGLVFAALVANTSLTGSVEQLTSGIVGEATLQVSGRGPDGFDQRTARRIQRIDGVRAGAPVLDVRADLVGPSARRSVTLFGGDARFAELDGLLLPHFSGLDLARQRTLGIPEPLARELGVALGQRVRVEVAGRVARVPVGARLQEDDIDTLVHSPVALASLSFAQRISGMTGRVSRVFVRPEVGSENDVAADLRKLSGRRLNVVAADAEQAIFERAAYPTSQSTTLFSVFSALVGFLFAFSAMLLTVPQRRRLLADLRMAGHEPWVLVQLLLFDALVLGMAGSLVGLGLGDQLSRHLFDSAPDYLSSAFAVGTQRIVTWQSAGIAVGAGLVAASVAVLAPLRDILARHPGRVGPSAATQPSERRFAVAGLACLAGAAAVGAGTENAARAGILLLTISLLLLLPVLLKAVTAAFEVLARRVRSPVPVLAVLEIRSRAAHTRTLAVAATGAVAVFATVAIGGANADLQRGLDASAREIDGNADIWVTVEGENNTLATAPFPEPARTAAVRRLPGVREVSAYRGSFLDVGDRRAWVLAPPRGAVRPIPRQQIRSGDHALATARIRRGGWVVLSEAIAEQQEVGVGDPVALPSPVPTTFRVAAISTNMAWPAGSIVLNADDYARAWGSDAVSALHVDLAAGVDPRRAKQAIQRTLGPALALRVETRRERTVRHYGTARDALSRMTQISLLVLVSAVLAMAAAMGGMIWQRRRTLAALKVHGYPDGELWRALLLESGLLLGTGCLIGAVFGLYGQLLLSRALETITGFPVVHATAALAAVGTLALVTFVAVAMLAVPGWLAVRVRAAPGGAR